MHPIIPIGPACSEILQNKSPPSVLNVVPGLLYINCSRLYDPASGVSLRLGCLQSFIHFTVGQTYPHKICYLRHFISCAVSDALEGYT